MAIGISNTTRGIIASSYQSTVTPAPSWTNTYSVRFDGVNELARTINAGIENDTKSGGRSISVWFKLDALINNGTLVRLQGNSTATYRGFWSLRLFNSGSNYVIRLQRRVNGGETFSPANVIDGSTPLAIGTWYNVVVTTNGSGHIFYLNGSVDMPRNTGCLGDWWGDCLFDDSQVGFALGGNPLVVNAILSGNIDEVTYWDGELTSSEVTELYNSGNPADPTTHSQAANLLSYWKMGDGDTYPTLQDSAGSYDLTMLNMESGDIETDVA